MQNKIVDVSPPLIRSPCFDSKMYQPTASDVAAEGAPDDGGTVDGGVVEPEMTTDDKEQEEQAARLRERLRLYVAKQQERSRRCQNS